MRLFAPSTDSLPAPRRLFILLSRRRALAPLSHGSTRRSAARPTSRCTLAAGCHMAVALRRAGGHLPLWRLQRGHVLRRPDAARPAQPAVGVAARARQGADAAERPFDDPARPELGAAARRVWRLERRLSDAQQPQSLHYKHQYVGGTLGLGHAAFGTMGAHGDRRRRRAAHARRRRRGRPPRPIFQRRLLFSHWRAAVDARAPAR